MRLICINCGATYDGRKGQKYCSRHCKDQVWFDGHRRIGAKRGLGVVEGVNAHKCPFCGHLTTNGAVYCSTCRREGFDNVHRMFGRTNGWNMPHRRQRHYDGVMPAPVYKLALPFKD